MPQFEVVPFSSANLFRGLSNTWCEPDEVAAQARADYLLRYLDALNARTLLIEYDYTDGDYLEDFASYYVRSFRNYDRRCKRLHFFAADFSQDVFLRLIKAQLDSGQQSDIVQSYLGFVVARPLPSAVIGRTLLKTYPSDNGRRHYTVLRDYKATLFGTEFPIRSLPYQEQDKVLAACATVALWCAFHKAAELFGTGAPRPAAITRSGSRIGHRGRPVPSKGLRVEEMCAAISDLGLEPELIDCEGYDVPWVSLAYAHLQMGLPVIAVVRLPNRGLHAITLTGFSLKPQRAHAKEAVIGGTAIPMTGLRIDEFYGHDDQIGPFAHLEVHSAAGSAPDYFSGSWKDPSTGQFLRLQPMALLVPIYNKIRVTFRNVVENWLTRLDSVLLAIIGTVSREWDVRLTTTNEFKRDVRNEPTLVDRETVLLTPQPRFLWVATLTVGGTPVVKVLIDATDMAPSFPVVKVLWMDEGFHDTVKILLSAPQMVSALSDALTPRFLTFLRSSL